MSDEEPLSQGHPKLGRVGAQAVASCIDAANSATGRQAQRSSLSSSKIGFRVTPVFSASPCFPAASAADW
jgi:hypothetical protein